MIHHGAYLTVITHGAEGEAGESEERLLLELEKARGCTVGYTAFFLPLRYVSLYIEEINWMLRRNLSRVLRDTPKGCRLLLMWP